MSRGLRVHAQVSLPAKAFTGLYVTSPLAEVTVAPRFTPPDYFVIAAAFTASNIWVLDIDTPTVNIFTSGWVRACCSSWIMLRRPRSQRSHYCREIPPCTRCRPCWLPGMEHLGIVLAHPPAQHAVTCDRHAISDLRQIRGPLIHQSSRPKLLINLQQPRSAQHPAGRLPPFTAEARHLLHRARAELVT